MISSVTRRRLPIRSMRRVPPPARSALQRRQATPWSGSLQSCRRTRPLAWRTGSAHIRHSHLAKACLSEASADKHQPPANLHLRSPRSHNGHYVARRAAANDSDHTFGWRQVGAAGDLAFRGFLSGVHCQAVGIFHMQTIKAGRLLVKAPRLTGDEANTEDPVADGRSGANPAVDGENPAARGPEQARHEGRDSDAHDPDDDQPLPPLQR
jgi:hypothetical protein